MLNVFDVVEKWINICFDVGSEETILPLYFFILLHYLENPGLQSMKQGLKSAQTHVITR